MNDFFEGYYFKHQKGADTIAFIVGVTADNAFIQVITNRASYNIDYALSAHRKGDSIHLGRSHFSEQGIKVDIEDRNVCIKGKIAYENLTQIKYDIMGIFKYFPVECKHSVISLHHQLTGSLIVNGETIDFTGGIGYIEGDKGKSFPKNYMWLQCSDFREKCCITAASADVPVLFFSFTGCICIVYYRNREYRFATYLGVKIVQRDKHCLILRQGRYRLEIFVAPNEGQPLRAPKHGKMSYEIVECATCHGVFRFYKNEELLFEFDSHNVSYEWVADED